MGVVSLTLTVCRFHVLIILIFILIILIILVCVWLRNLLQWKCFYYWQQIKKQEGHVKSRNTMSKKRWRFWQMLNLLILIMYQFIHNSIHHRMETFDGLLNFLCSLSYLNVSKSQKECPSDKDKLTQGQPFPRAVNLLTSAPYWPYCLLIYSGHSTSSWRYTTTLGIVCNVNSSSPIYYAHSTPHLPCLWCKLISISITAYWISG